MVVPGCGVEDSRDVWLFMENLYYWNLRTRVDFIFNATKVFLRVCCFEVIGVYEHLEC